MLNKNTETIYEFYSSKLADPKSLKNKNICLLALGNAKYELECKKYAKSALILHDYDNDDPFNGVDFKDINSLKERIENWLRKNEMKKFNTIVMNPPYDRSLHLKILEAVIPFAEKTVNISPIRWLQDPLAKYKKNSSFNKYESTIVKHIVDVDCIDSNDAQNIFTDAVFCIDLGIYECSCKIIDSFVLSNTNSVLDKVIPHVLQNGGIPTEVYANRKYDNFMLIASIIGGGGRSQNCFVSKPGLNYNEKIYGKYFVNGLSELRHETLPVCKQKYGGYWGKCENWKICSFATENELKNFYDSTLTKFFKYVYWTFIIDVHVNNECLPFMRDYSRPWTDKRFCEYFGITGYISDNEAEPGSEWETILDSVTKK